MSRSLAFLLLGCAFVAACASSARLPVATQADAERSGVQLARLEAGRSLYLNRCSSCHRPIQPSRYAAGEWTEHVMEMREKAQLDGEETQAVLDYLQAMAEAPLAAN